MKFRYARHTNDLRKIEHFYTHIIGLEKLGEFKDHDHYNGIFLGLPGADWHLEFTTSPKKPISRFDEDDALVFYVNTAVEFREIEKTIRRNIIEIETPLNPYWSNNGLQVSDPDGYKIIFSILHIPLVSADEYSNLLSETGLHNWSELIEFVRSLPYGRNRNRHDLSLVLTEGKGTCSSKHALLKKIADLHKVDQVKLVIGIYKMDHLNTPGIRSTIIDSGLNYIPEAHCYLKLHNKRFDLTSPGSNIERLEEDLLEEIEIEPGQVDSFKTEYHKNYLQKWIIDNSINMPFDKVWAIRESCISNLQQ